MKHNKQIHVLFEGQVQGVGFRYTVQHIAHSYKVTGYVRNLMDGNVELSAEGEEGELEQFVTAICDSPLKNYIRHCERSWREASGAYERFTIAF